MILTKQQSSQVCSNCLHTYSSRFTFEKQKKVEENTISLFRPFVKDIPVKPGKF